MAGLYNPLSTRFFCLCQEGDGKIHLVLHINHSYDMQVNLVLKSDIYGDLSVVQATPSRALKFSLGGRVFIRTVDPSRKGRCYYISWSLGSGHKPAYVAQVRRRWRRLPNLLDNTFRTLTKKSKGSGPDTHGPASFSRFLNCPNHDKLNLAMEHMVYGRLPFLQLGKPGYKFSKKLEPILLLQLLMRLLLWRPIRRI